MSDHDDDQPSQSPDLQHLTKAEPPEHAPRADKHHLPHRRQWAIAALAIAAAVTVTLTTGNSSPQVPRASEQNSTFAQQIDALLAGIPQTGNTLGSPTAPVTLQYFGDLECSTTRAFTLGTLPSVIRKWVRSGKLRIEYRSLRTVSEPEVFSVQQVAALATGMQHKLWYYLEDFYHEQGHEHSGYVTEGYLSALARQVPGLNLGLWADDRHDPLLATQVTKDEHAADAARLHDTPSFLVGRTGSAPIRSLGQSSTLGDVNEAVRQALDSQPRSSS